MIRYKLYQGTNPLTKGKWYARASHEAVTFDEFVKHIANHHCIFSEATLRAVLGEVKVCLRELLLEGKAVRIDDLGIFSLSIKSTGVSTLKKFNVASNIQGVRVNWYLGKQFTAAELFKDATFKEFGTYSVSDATTTAEDEGERAVAD